MKKLLKNSALIVLLLSFIQAQSSWIGVSSHLESLRKKCFETQLNLLKLDDKTKGIARIIGDGYRYYFLPYGLIAKTLLGYRVDQNQTQRKGRKIEFKPDSTWPDDVQEKIKTVLKDLETDINITFQKGISDENELSASLFDLEKNYLGVITIGKNNIEKLTIDSPKGLSGFDDILHELGHIAMKHTLQTPPSMEKLLTLLSACNLTRNPAGNPTAKALETLSLAPFICLPCALIGNFFIKDKPKLNLLLGIALTTQFSALSLSATIAAISQYQEKEADAYVVLASNNQDHCAIDEARDFYQKKVAGSSWIMNHTYHPIATFLYSTHPSDTARASFFKRCSQQLKSKNGALQ